MATEKLMNEWNKHDHEGSIQPPLDHDDIDALTRQGVGPETYLDMPGHYRHMARIAYIKCGHQFRVPGDPELTAEAVAAFK